MKLLGRPGTPAASSPLGRPGTPSPACKLDGKWYKELGNQWKSGQTWWGIYVWSIMKTRCKCHKIIQHHLSRAQYHSTTLNCQHPIAVFFQCKNPLPKSSCFHKKRTWQPKDLQHLWHMAKYMQLLQLWKASATRTFLVCSSKKKSSNAKVHHVVRTVIFWRLFVWHPMMRKLCAMLKDVVKAWLYDLWYLWSLRKQLPTFSGIYGCKILSLLLSPFHSSGSHPKFQKNRAINFCSWS